MLFKRLGMIFLFAIFIISLNGCNEDKTANKPQVKTAPVFDPLIAKEKAAKRIANVDVDAPSLPRASDYIRLVVTHNSEHKSPSGFLSDLTSPDSKSVVLLAHIENGEALKLPPVPLFIFEKKGASWSTTFQANGPLTPLFVAQRAALSASIEIVLLKEHLDGLDKDAEELIQAYATRLPLYSKDGEHEISQLADGFASRIALVEEASFKNIAAFNVSYLENLGSSINLLSGTGEVSLTSTFSITGKTSVLPLVQDKPPLYSELLSHKIGTQSPRSALGDLETSFWSVPVDALHPSCQAIRGALIERLGLSNRDSALILWRMIQPHALFAEGIDYTVQCSGVDVAQQLSEMGFALPQIKKTRPSSKDYNAMNKALSTIASLVKNTKASNEEKMATLMASNVLVRDQARLLFSEEPNQTIESTTDVIAPTLSKEEAAQYLMALPIKAYGCYSNGQGQVGNHRSTLLSIENDPNLWMLNFAFDEDNKINGIYLGSVDQLEYCRAIGARLTQNKCVFSDKNFPGLSTAKCAK